MTNKKQRIAITVFFAGIVLIPVIAISVFGYNKISSVYVNSNISRLAQEFHGKSTVLENYLNSNPVVNDNKFKDKFTLMKFKNTDSIYIYDKGVYRNIYDLSDNIKLDTSDLTPVYISMSTKIYNFKEDKDIYINNIVDGNNGIAVISDTRLKDYGVSDIVFSFTFVLLGIILVTILISWVLTLKIRFPEQKLKAASDRILKGDFENGAINYKDNEEFNELFQVFNQVVKSELVTLDKLKFKSTSLEKELSAFESMVKMTEKTMKNILSNNMDLEVADVQIETIINTVMDVIFKTDNCMNLTYVNRSFENIVGLDYGDIVGKNIYEFVYFIEKEATHEDTNKLRNAFIVSRKFRNIIVRFKKPDGSLSDDYSMNSKPIEGEDGKPGIQAICRELRTFDIVEESINKRNYELNQIREINKNLSSSYDIEDILNIIIQKMRGIVDAGFISIRLLNEHNELELRSYYTESEDYIQQNNLKLDDNLVNDIFYEKDFVILKRNEDHQVFASYGFENYTDVFQEIVVVPIKHEHSRAGVLILGVYTELDESEKKLLASFAHQTAIAIDKARLYDKLRQDYMNTIKALASAVEAKDEYTEGHSYRVSRFSTVIAKEMGIEGDDLTDVEISGILHDIGKIGISDAILTKPGRLTDEEFDAIKQHPMVGGRIVGPIGLPQSVVDGILLHHCKYDLTGYPNDTGIEELSLVARIIGVSDAFDAITSKRSYSDKRSLEIAFEELGKFSGTQFCPEVVKAFQNIYQREPHIIEQIVQEGHVG